MKDLYKGRADSAKRLRSVLGTDKDIEDAAIDFVEKNLEHLMESDLPDEEKEYLAQLVELKGGDLEYEIDDYVAAYHNDAADTDELSEVYDGDIDELS